MMIYPKLGVVAQTPEDRTRIDALLTAYQKIADAAEFTPDFYVCNIATVNAFALYHRKRPTIGIHVPMLELVRWDVNLIGVVLGHEFAHLKLGHFQADARLDRAIETIKDKQVVNSLADLFNLRARTAAFEQWAARQRIQFARDLELEADGKGYTWAITRAGFDKDSPTRIAQLLTQLEDSSPVDYLSDHPSARQREVRAQAVTANEAHLVAARGLAAKRNWSGLQLLVDKWLAAVPDSGSAWYYRGIANARGQSHHGRANHAFIMAAGYFGGSKSLGIASQEDHVELHKVWPQLCSGLLAEGARVEAYLCSENLQPQSLREEFRARHFAADVVHIAPRLDPRHTRFWISSTPDGRSILTSDEEVAKRFGGYARQSLD